MPFNYTMPIVILVGFLMIWFGMELFGSSRLASCMLGGAMFSFGVVIMVVGALGIYGLVMAG